jgi:hypothetical protein
VKTIISVSNSPRQFKQKIGKLRKKAVFPPETPFKTGALAMVPKKMEY